MLDVHDPATIVTPRQAELIALYASGYDTTEIAAMKFNAVRTVINTLALARANVGARSLTHLCVLCLEANVIFRDGEVYKPVVDAQVVG